MSRTSFLPLLFLLAAVSGLAQEQSVAAAEQQATTTAAAAAVATGKVPPANTDFLEHVVDSILGLFDIQTGENTATHFVIAALFLTAGLFLRRVVTNIIFNQLRRFASKTETTLDDKLFPALEGPVATFVMLVGIFSGFKVLKFSAETDLYLSTGSKVAFSLLLFWGLLRSFSAVLDHAHEVSRAKNLGVAAFMPWIKKTLVVVFVVIGTLMVIQNLGYGESVKTLLAGLGIGGLAFALAAQDTIANLFGAIVVAIDQPFKIGETVRIGTNVGTVEDIGLRSTKIRLLDRSVMVIPNKTVASETITNLARFNGRRVEQVITLTYDSTEAQLNGIVEDFRRLMLAEKEIDETSVVCYFRDFSSSSMDVWLVYAVKSPDFHQHMALRQRLNFAFMRAVEARGLSFAFPTQTLHLASMPEANARLESSEPSRN